MSRRFLFTLLTSTLLFFYTTTLVRAQESSWAILYENYYLSSVETTPWSLLSGENDGRVWNKPFNGIYESNDFGKTWKKMGLENKGITNIKYSNNNIYATTYYHTDTYAGLFVSEDQGTTWKHLGPPYSANNIEVLNHTLFLGTTAHGLFVSFDEGITWEQKTPEIEIKQIKNLNSEVYAVGNNRLFKTKNKGVDWEELPYKQQFIEETYKKYIYNYKDQDIFQNNAKTNLNKIVKDLAVIHLKEPLLIAVVDGEGLYKYNIPKNKLETNSFLRIPWEYTEENELIDKITAYFDHEYPLLGNPYVTESNEVKDTTLNFLGIKEKQPKLYYSSHNGTDFSLPYGTHVYAVADGTAKYFWCYDCGNSIEIDHKNGYKSIYMHLQEDLEIDKSHPTEVFQGQFIGKVGMTGRTTGPHLHLTIKDQDKVVDPYGWQNDSMPDPWEIFTNNTISGSKSKYLWNNLLHQTSSFVDAEENKEIILDNKKIIFEKELTKIGLSIYLKNYIKPYKQLGLKYINNTSTLIEAFNLLGDLTSNIPAKVKLSFFLPEELLDKRIGIWYFNKEKTQWEPMDTFFDVQNKSIFTYTNHFSQFAVFESTSIEDNTFTKRVVVKNTNMSIFKPSP